MPRENLKRSTRICNICHGDYKTIARDKYKPRVTCGLECRLLYNRLNNARKTLKDLNAFLGAEIYKIIEEN